jgi:hypothetical protein
MLTAKRSWSLELQISDRFGVFVADIPNLSVEAIQIRSSACRNSSMMSRNFFSLDLTSEMVDMMFLNSAAK